MKHRSFRWCIIYFGTQYDIHERFCNLLRKDSAFFHSLKLLERITDEKTMVVTSINIMSYILYFLKSLLFPFYRML